MFKFNGTTPKNIEFNGVDLCRVFMNGVQVFQQSDTLYLPAPSNSNTINLRSWINGQTLASNCGAITVINNHTQPKIVTGNLSGLTVEFINNGEIQGNYAGANALEVTSSMKLTNNGWIRGAGGNGGRGGTNNNYSKNVYYWGYERWGDNGSCTSTGIHSDRWWRSSGGPNSGAWISAGCAGQQYWDINTDGNWGDQGKCTTRPNGSGCGARGSEGIRWGFPKDSIAFISAATWKITAGTSGGNGGYGRWYGHNRTNGSLGSSAKSTGSRSLTSTSFDRCTGRNFSAPSLTSYYGKQGGNGGDWGNWGSNGTNGNKTNGASGTQGGKSITGTSKLVSGSKLGSRKGGTSS